MRSGTNASQKVPADFAELLQDFRRSIIQARKVHKIDPSDIINMDQTMVRFDMPRSKTNDVRGKKDIRIKTTKAEKKGFTVALAATATGEKLPAVIFFKEKGGSLGVRVRRAFDIPDNVRVRAKTNGWQTAVEYQWWLRSILKRKDHRRLLVVDQYRPHQNSENIEIAKADCNAEVVLIPGGCTSLAQPMDKCVNRPFKEAVRQSWEEWMRIPRALTQKGNLMQPTRQDVISWVSKAWCGIKTDLLVKSFLVCGISNALDGSQDDFVCDKVPALDANSTESESADEEDTEDAEDLTDSDVDDLDPFDDFED